ncbi:MAG: GGDEF domain-containing protein [Methylophaga sp.]|nr:GGDEF domain-containing protein [Methylophaga sp.]
MNDKQALIMPPRLIVSRGGFARQLLLGLLLLVSGNVLAEAPKQAVDLTQSAWQFQWGDFSVNDAEFGQADRWQPISFPANPPDRQGRQYIWFKTSLPEAYVHNPVIYATSINLTVAAYLDGEKIYQFGAVNAADAPSFEGWPWHAIPLPENYAGKTLALKIFSDYTDIGFWGDLWLVDRSDLQLNLLKTGIVDLIIAAFSLLLGLMALLFTTVRRDSQDFLYLGLFALVTAGSLVGENLAVQLIIEAPLLQRYIAALSYFAMPIFLAMLLSHWCQQRDRHWFVALAGLHGIFWSVALVLSLSGVFNLAIFYPMFDVLLLASALVMLILARRHYAQLSREQKLVMLAFVFFAVFLFVDMLIAHSLLPWMDFPMGLGALLFTMIVAAVSVHHYKQMQDELHKMNLLLEQRVAERTESLQAYADREVERSQQLTQINHYSLGLEELISQLQKTADLQTAGELVCQQIPKIFAPRQMQIRFAESVDSLTAEQHTSRHIIEVEDIQGQVLPFIVIDCFESHDKAEIQPLMDEFIGRVLARLSVTLSSIKLRESLHKMSFEDALTGLKNRRFFDEALLREQHIALRNQRSLALLMCDIDHFKRFNDLYGHDAGDMALRTVAKIMLEHFRETDIPCRFGGEEFVVVVPGASLEDVLSRAQALLNKVALKTIIYKGKPLDALTISVGIACWQGETAAPDNLLQAADKALYQAKQAGRNQVVVSTADDFPGKKPVHA